MLYFQNKENCHIYAEMFSHDHDITLPFIQVFKLSSDSALNDRISLPHFLSTLSLGILSFFGIRVTDFICCFLILLSYLGFSLFVVVFQ